jgi:metal-responsive CopG/Arc/MetJ family transcriptional regulator
MTIKTAISLDDTLFEQVESLMQELEMSRSRLIATALQEFIKRRETQKMVAALHEAYADFPDEEEAVTQQDMQRHHQQLMADEPW